MIKDLIESFTLIMKHFSKTTIFCLLIAGMFSCCIGCQPLGFDPEGGVDGVHEIPIEVNITNTLSSSTVYFTTDGSDPTPASTVYTGPIHLDTTTTLKAVSIINNVKFNTLRSTYTFVSDEEWRVFDAPVFTGNYIASDPCIIKEENYYRMYYTDMYFLDDVYAEKYLRSCISSAISFDGLTWTYEGITLKGRKNSWEEDIEATHVIKKNGKYLLYYSGYSHKGGYPAQGYPAKLSVADSTDGIHFERVSNDPVLSPTPGWYDNDAVYSPSIIQYGEELVMIYAGHCWTHSQTGELGVFLITATSDDGLIWTKRDVPALKPDAKMPWHNIGVAEPSLISGPDGKYYLFFTGVGFDDWERAIGVAMSDTPFGPWQFLTIDPHIARKTGTFRNCGALAPDVLIENGKVRMWYLGYACPENFAIGYAETDWPLN